MSHFTDLQKAAIKAYILSVPALASKPLTSGANGEIAVELNKAASPDYIVWKPSISQSDVQQSDGWDWTRVDNLSVGKARIWEWLFKFGSIAPSSANVRAGIDAAWVGTAADLANRAIVYTVAKRKATVFEKLLATGTGTTQSPANMAAEGIGLIGADHVSECRES